MIAKKVKALSAALAITVMFLVGLIYADSNGVWHQAEDIEVGQFGQDEGVTAASGAYTFVNPVAINNNLDMAAGGNIVDGTHNVDPSGTSVMNTIEVSTITSGNSNGNVVIQLGP